MLIVSRARSHILNVRLLIIPLVAAVIQMGDPTHVVGLPFDVGNSTRNGVSVSHFSFIFLLLIDWF